ncbi:hypothetical protein ACFPZ0_11705 [Streptomonospora nanhaiensis]|uniref:Uncharacterized protein n=1 Tax=Streptomonospora nanhaiensis TaxID=1323731 RepID=A0A853BMJ0_9ACTN|nr:hypothetical protein [Streptomonospora nanhaiensis]MBV2365917.1 hypothetical protein [Streptomonospora nanhaiensis]MBX9388996.1 hypothetical protein [Streptomonospora nanhaiensis]NYI95806.1 hypothetical protein [Streptomonospora nanhaiensis]
MAGPGRRGERPARPCWWTPAGRGDATLRFTGADARYAYAADDARTHGDCVETARAGSGDELNASIPLDAIGAGERFCVLDLYDTGAIDADLVTVEEVDPAEGTLTLGFTAWGDA